MSDRHAYRNALRAACHADLAERERLSAIGPRVTIPRSTCARRLWRLAHQPLGDWGRLSVRAIGHIVWHGAP